MRKLKLQMQMSVDGFVARSNGALDWMSTDMNETQLQRLKELTESMDTIIMGRKMADGFTNYWESVVDNQPDSPEYAYAKIFVDTPKVIFSKTIHSLKGRNTKVENGDLATAVNQLKQHEGRDIIVYGGASFVSELIKLQLIDELHLFINPAALGDGLKIFHDTVNLKLLSSTDCGNSVVVNVYGK